MYLIRLSVKIFPFYEKLFIGPGMFLDYLLLIKALKKNYTLDTIGKAQTLLHTKEIDLYFTHPPKKILFQ